MKKVFFTLVFLILQLGCQSQQIAYNNPENINLPSQVQTATDSFVTNTVNETPKSDEQTNQKAYPGVTIDKKFPIIEQHNFTEKGFKERKYSVNAEDFQVSVEKGSPKTINKNGKTIFNFKTLYPNYYWSNLIGMSYLLGESSKEIYVVATGPGAVCCTNYWITDVSTGTPRNIFRSEDFGGFRNPMEIFDANGDGIYELVQFDSTFRYFMDDCGSCSPEPRAVFKYNKKTGTYLPAKNIQQDFVKESFGKTEKWLAETFEKLNKEKDISLEVDFNRALLAHTVDLFYLGNDSKAWETFDKYHFKGVYKEKTRAEIKKRLRQSKFYQALHALSP